MTVTEVSKSFGEAHALRSCSFSARTGEVHAIVGENGSGKSTLAKLLAGVFPPDSGNVRIDAGRPSNPRIASRLGISLVFQEVLVAEGATVLDNLFLGHDALFRASFSERQKRLRAHELLAYLVGSPVDLDATVDDLPLSTRQWIVIGRALLRSPRVVAFDESTAALDHSSAERFLDVVGELRSSGVCVLIVTHRIHELTTVCDRATVLSDGLAVGTLTGDEITEPRLLELMSGEVQSAATSRPAREHQGGESKAPADETLIVSGLKLRAEAAPIDLAARAGEVIGLAGLEGHGQVDFIQAVTGFGKMVAGHISVNLSGQSHTIDSPQSAARANVAYIPGDRKSEGVFPNLSVFENFGIGCYRRMARAGFIRRQKVEALFREQLEGLSIRVGRQTASINSLSGGNQQKVVVGRALASSPLILALNDPTRGVDIGTKRHLYMLLRSLAAEGKVVLFLSNEIEEFEGTCDRVIVFRFQSIFATLWGREITSDSVLAAMFGYTDTQSLYDGRH